MTHDLTLSAFQEIFEHDGALVDLYVLDTSTEDWQRLLDELRAQLLPLQYRDYEVGDEPVSLPERVDTIFHRNADEARCLLTVDPGGLNLNCHFFTPDEIEFDLAPQDIQSEELAAKLASFVMRVSDVVGKPVLLCSEGMREYPCFIANPTSVGRTCWGNSWVLKQQPEW